MNANRFHTSCHKRLCAWLLALAMIMVALPTGGALADSAVGGFNAKVEGSQVNILPVAKVNIEKKMLEAVITNVGDQFKVSKETIITDLNGKQVSIREMLVPCDVEITYESENGTRVAHRIKIVRISRNNSWKWMSKQPE